MSLLMRVKAPKVLHIPLTVQRLQAPIFAESHKTTPNSSVIHDALGFNCVPVGGLPALPLPAIAACDRGGRQCAGIQACKCDCIAVWVGPRPVKAANAAHAAKVVFGCPGVELRFGGSALDMKHNTSSTIE